MKTILSLTATATLLGLISLAVAESKATKSVKAASMKPAPSAEPVKMTAKSEESAPRKSASAKPGPKEATAAPAGNKVTAKPVAKNRLTPAQEDKLLVLLNEGTLEELDAIPGVATTRADSIISARPFASVHEIILVDGVGNATFEKILAHGKVLAQRPAVAETNLKS